MKNFIFFIILVTWSILPQSKEELIQIEKEDALMEIIVKEKQREIEEEKRSILEEEAEYIRSLSSTKKQVYYYDFFLPGLGHFYRGNYFKAFTFGASFWLGAYFTNFHYQQAKHISSQIESQSIYNPFVSFYLIPQYKHHNKQSEMFTIATLGIYIINLFISFNDETSLEVELTQKIESLNSKTYEFKLSFSF